MFAANASICVDDPGPGLGHRRGHRLGRLRRALGDDLFTEVEGVAVEPDRRALVHPREHIRSHVVDERDTGLDQQLRAEVGVAAADAGRRVHHGGHLPAIRASAADPVQVGRGR